LPLAEKLIKISTTYQEFEESIRELSTKQNKKKIRKSLSVKYWGIIAIINNRKIKVILRKIGNNGDVHFWSVIPSWVTHKYRDTKLFSMMKGNPSED
jgi:abortive infection bacteriophage resistance protein